MIRNERVRTALPIAGVALFLLAWIAVSFWLALGLAITAALAVAAYWAWTRLPERYEEGPDSAELKEREKRKEEVQEGS